MDSFSSLTVAKSSRRSPGLIGPGAIIGGAYRAGALLGRGGQGEVYECLDIALGRQVAVKISSDGRELLRREGQVLAALKTPAVPAVYALGAEPGFDYLAMERIHGHSLLQHNDQRAVTRQPFAISEALELVSGIADGLSAVHRAGIAHRDIKPANIMLAPGARVVLMDFGITLPEVNVAASAEISGTPTYMAPESISQDLASGEAWRVDIYALGVVAYEIFCGTPPFVAASVPELFLQHLEARPAPLVRYRATVPLEISKLVDAMLSKDPLDRPLADEVVWTVNGTRERRSSLPPERFRVLIADDDADQRSLLERWVGEAVHDPQIETVSCGEACLRAFGARPPHLLLLDLHLGDMNGIEVCLNLKGTPSGDRCCIVPVTATGQPKDRELLAQLGVANFVPKDAQAKERILAHARAAAWRRGF